jgi:hypothetical protein
LYLLVVLVVVMAQAVAVAQVDWFTMLHSL